MVSIDFSQPLRLGFTFSHAAKKVHKLVRAYGHVGIPAEDIRPIDPNVLAEWTKRGWDVSVYAMGSEDQLKKIQEWGYALETCHVLGPWK